MNAMWQILEGRLCKSTCERIISLASLLPEQQAVVGSDDISVRTDTQIRRSKIRWLYNTMPDFKDFHTDIVDLFRNINRHSFGVELWH